jgi:quercetin dioxygenase-like cupin family protein
MTAAVTVTPPEGAETLWVIRDRLRLMGEVPGTGLVLLEVEVPPGSGTPPHRHPSPEIFRVETGTFAFGLFEDGPPREALAGPGTVVSVAPNAAHSYRNAGPGTATMSVVLDTSMLAFFRDLGRTEPPPAGPPGAEEIAGVVAACARHGITLLPPP